MQLGKRLCYTGDAVQGRGAPPSRSTAVLNLPALSVTGCRRKLGTLDDGFFSGQAPFYEAKTESRGVWHKSRQLPRGAGTGRTGSTETT